LQRPWGDARGVSILDPAGRPSTTGLGAAKVPAEKRQPSAVHQEGEMPVTIYHNPKCGTSRNTLAMIRASGVEPTVIEYLQTPPDKATIKRLIEAMGIAPRELLRRKGTPYDELGLDDPALTDEQIIDAMLAHPILINRPIVVTSRGARLCRPSEAVLEILENPDIGTFTKEDGETVSAHKPAVG
jgi:arsenate reductase